MMMGRPSHPHPTLSTTDTETSELIAILGAEHGQSPRARSACRLTAGAAGALLVVAAVAAAASPPEERGTPACEGPSCMARSDHLDKVLELKQNTLALEDCPLGYYGTVLNIKGKGKQWTIGNLTACATVCDEREGCKGFEFHDKNGKCGTYTDGYILGGKQFHRWLTCVKDGTRAANGMFTINNLTFQRIVDNSSAQEAVEGAVRESVAKHAGVPPHKVGVGLSAGSVVASFTIAEGGIDSDADQLTAVLEEAGAQLLDEVLEKLKATPIIMELKDGELTTSGYIVRTLEHWDPRTTTASEAATTSAGER